MVKYIKPDTHIGTINTPSPDPMELIFFILALLFPVVGYLAYRAGIKHGLAQSDLRMAQALQESSRQQADARTDAARVHSDLSARLETTTAQLQKAQEQVRNLQERNGQLEALQARQQAELEQARRELLQRAEEQRGLLEKYRADFENLANRIFHDSTKRLGDQNKSGLEGLITPLQQQIEAFRTAITDTNVQQAERHGGLQKALEQFMGLSRQLDSDARDLANALRGDVQKRGHWGEMVLERVFEASGLRRGHEYELQISTVAEGGEQFRPDAVVHLPSGRDVVVDSKVSFVGWDEYLQAQNEDTRAAALRKHLLTIESQIRELSERDYARLQGVNSLDAILLFVPIEPALATALEHKPQLMDEAMRKKVILVGPSTLWVVLKTIEHSWTHERRERNATRIAVRAGALLDKLSGVVEGLNKAEKTLNTLRGHHTGIRTALEGNGGAYSAIRELKRLGAQNLKRDPAILETLNTDDLALLERSETDSGSPEDESSDAENP